MTATRPSPVRVRPRTLAGLTLLLAGALALTGCAGAVDIEPVSLSDEDRAACQSLVADLPDEVFGQPRAEVSPDDALGAAWGDPAVVLECGVDQPDDFDPFSPCSEIEGVGWFIPDNQLKDFGQDVVMTTESHTPRVRLSVPTEWRQDGPDRALTTLAEPLKEHLTEFNPCR